MEELKAIVSKVRKMYQFDTVVKDMVKEPTSIRVQEKDNEFDIEAIIFGDEGCFVVLKDAIKYYDIDEDRWVVLLTYNNFEELVSL